MLVLLLGPVSVVDGPRVHSFASGRQAALLARLALAEGRPVTRDALVDAVWGDAPPATSRNTLQVHASALRRRVGHGHVCATGDGYRWQGSLEVDGVRFSDLVRDGTQAHADGRYADAARLLRSALALWRGEPFNGLTSTWFEAERERLRRLRLTATLARLDADLALGRHLMLVDELSALATEHPYDEGVVARRMLALYRSGRQTEALHVYDAMRRLLRDELGVDTGPQLRTLHGQVLRQDPDLERERVRSVLSWRIPLDHRLGPLVGRDALVARLDAELPLARVHALVGPSGVGKTRLATQLGVRAQARYPDGATLVPAADINAINPLVDRLLAAVAGDEPAPGTPAERRHVVESAEALVILDDLNPNPQLLRDLDALVAAGRSTFVTTSTRPPGLAGEYITGVAPLALPDAGRLLLARARRAGADLPDDEETRVRAERCGELLDGFPLAVELVAPLAVGGLVDLVASLERRLLHDTVDPLQVSFASSLSRLDPSEAALLDLLSSAAGPVDAELVADVGLAGSLPGLVRDGLVRQSMGTHGAGVYAVVRHVGAYVRATRGDRRDRVSRGRLIDALAELVGPVGPYLPMLLPSPPRARRLVMLEPAAVQAVADARRLGRAGAAAGLALLLPELHFSRHGVAPPPGRSAWLIDDPATGPEGRVDLLLSHCVELLYDNQPRQALAACDRALVIVDALDDPARRAQVLAHRVTILTEAGPVGGSEDDQHDLARRAIRAAEAAGAADVLAGTLMLLYPLPGTPDDLQGTLARAVIEARSARHAGLLSISLANLALWELSRGDAEGAALHAREALAIAEDLHNRASVALMRATTQAAEALAGTGTALADVSVALAAAWERRETRTASDCLLKLAAGGLRQRGPEVAGRCLGIYRAVLEMEGLAANEVEAAFIAQWLDGVQPTPTTAPLREAVPCLVREFTG